LGNNLGRRGRIIGKQRKRGQYPGLRRAIPSEAAGTSIVHLWDGVSERFKQRTKRVGFSRWFVVMIHGVTKRTALAVIIEN
jgi:hypothetical protein